MSAIVECHSEFAYAEKPIALTINNIRLEITELLSRWRSPDAVHFKVNTAADQIFELTYDEASDVWLIQQI